ALHSHVRVIDKPNSGHGQTCVEGYRQALRDGADWIFQIDSDGQCDPQYFQALWSRRESSGVLFGYRRRRDDGWFRYAVSHILSATVLLATGQWVRDSNVPYRLMRADALSGIVPQIPSDFDLANVLVAVLLAEKFPITWIDIRFRNRYGRPANTKFRFFWKKAVQLWLQLRAFRASTRRAPAIRSETV
ncbi:MAG TPA: glycosyltransferase, partial [Verrucomicrobiae bacterium]|nr:glycosyltransferase [Verrucomicrobiae bacterium]